MFTVPPRLRILSRRAALIAGTSLALALGSCSDEGSGPVVVSVIGSRTELAKPLQNLPNPAAKLILEATAQGLVAFDAGGDILPALAQRWWWRMMGAAIFSACAGLSGPMAPASPRPMSPGC